MSKNELRYEMTDDTLRYYINIHNEPEDIHISDAASQEMAEELLDLRERTRWILVTEKLPEDDIEVLVFDGLDIFLAIHDDGAWYADGHAVDVEVWMLLPEPPEVKEWKK